MTPAEKRAKEKYDSKNTVQIKLKLNLKTDKDILEALKRSGNKQGYIKRLIREDLQKKNKGV
jgi:uncharacterized protein (DUF4415 family)